MRRLSLIIIGLLLIQNCNKDSCEGLINIRYHYPSLPSNHSGMTPSEVDRYFDLPKNVAHCLSTDTLIQSVLDYPYVSLFFAGSTPQVGYNMVYKQFRGLPELENRSDRGHSLLKLYEATNPLGFDKNWDTLTIGYYILREINTEIIQSQYVNLQNLDALDFNEMFARSIEVFDLKKTEMDFYGYFGLSFNTTQVARMMLLRKYEPFVSLYNSNNDVHNLTESFVPYYTSLIELIDSISRDYLKKIKK